MNNTLHRRSRAPPPFMDNRIIDDPLAAFEAAMARKDAAKNRADRERNAYRSVSLHNSTLAG